MLFSAPENFHISYSLSILILTLAILLTFHGIKKLLLVLPNDNSNLDISKSKFLQNNILWRTNKLSDWMVKFNFRILLYIIKFLHSLGLSNENDILELEQKIHVKQPFMSKLIRITLVVAIITVLIT